MERRNFLSSLMALPFVAMFGKFAKAEKPQLRMNQSYFGQTIPVVMGACHPPEFVMPADYTGPELSERRTFPYVTRSLRYAYSWRSENGQIYDFTAVPEIDGKFTFPHRTEGYNVVVPGPEGEPDSWYDTEGKRVFPFDGA